MAPRGRSSVESIERVEILRGPSTMLNGMAPERGVGGVISLVPKRAADVPLTRISASYDSTARLGTHLDVGRVLVQTMSGAYALMACIARERGRSRARIEICARDRSLWIIEERAFGLPWILMLKRIGRTGELRHIVRWRARTSSGLF